MRSDGRSDDDHRAGGCQAGPSGDGAYRDCARALLTTLDTWHALDPAAVGAAARADAIRQLQVVKAKVAALELLLVGASQDVARAAGHRDTAAWYAASTHADVGTARSLQRTALGLGNAPHVAEALRSGQVSQQHARAVLESLDQLPDVPAALREQAETRLVEHAQHLPPRQVAARGKGILDEIDPRGDHRHLGTTLADETRHAWAATRLRFHDHRDGTTGIEGIVPTPVASRLKTVLDAFASPRSAHSRGDAGGANGRAGRGGGGCNGAGGAGSDNLASTAEVDSVDGASSAGGGGDPRGPDRASSVDAGAAGGGRGGEAVQPVAYETRLGHALCSVLENLDPAALPRHGGTATTVLVTIDHRELLDDLGTGRLVDADATAVSAGEARRLACNAGIVPLILGTRSQVLDMGTRTRLFTPAQVIALRAARARCEADGCTIPAAWCEAHHVRPWSHGGRTDLSNAMLLCSHHHHRIHDPAYEAQRRSDGAVTFRQRGRAPLPVTPPPPPPGVGTTARQPSRSRAA